jgi:hypothetical protein
MNYSDKKMACAAFWTIFSQTHLATLIPSRTCRSRGWPLLDTKMVLPVTLEPIGWKMIFWSRFYKSVSAVIYR